MKGPGPRAPEKGAGQGTLSGRPRQGAAAPRHKHRRYPHYGEVTTTSRLGGGRLGAWKGGGVMAKKREQVAVVPTVEGWGGGGEG